MEDSIIMGGLTDGTIFDCGSSILEIKNSTIKNAENNMFLISSSKLFLEKTVIIDHECSSILQGCLIFAKEDSFVVGQDLYIIGIISKTNDNIYFFTSSGLFDSINMKKTSAKKLKGACLGSSFSSINIFKGNFEDYDGNCLNNENSLLYILNVTFHRNEIVQKRNLDISAFICINCRSYYIEYSNFIENKFAYLGSAIKILSDFKNNDEMVPISTINRCNFIENEALKDGGAIYIKNQNLLIENSSFVSNLAKNGGAIFSLIQSS
jgi:predicted outer membrane repeat protein